jgi:hypothetical protein
MISSHLGNRKAKTIKIIEILCYKTKLTNINSENINPLIFKIPIINQANIKS